MQAPALNAATATVTREAMGPVGGAEDDHRVDVPVGAGGEVGLLGGWGGALLAGGDRRPVSCGAVGLEEVATVRGQAADVYQGHQQILGRGQRFD